MEEHEIFHKKIDRVGHNFLAPLLTPWPESMVKGLILFHVVLNHR